MRVRAAAIPGNLFSLWPFPFFFFFLSPFTCQRQQNTTKMGEQTRQQRRSDSRLVQRVEEVDVRGLMRRRPTGTRRRLRLAALRCAAASARPACALTHCVFFILVVSLFLLQALTSTSRSCGRRSRAMCSSSCCASAAGSTASWPLSTARRARPARTRLAASATRPSRSVNAGARIGMER